MQRLGQTVVFLFVFVAVALLCLFVAAPHVRPSNPAVSASAPLPSVSEPANPFNTSPALPDAAISVPRTASQREADGIEARRAPYYRWLRAKFGDVLSAQQAGSADAATLDLTMNRADPSLVLALLGQAVQPYAARYGFSHVRFFQPNPPGDLERYRFAAEAAPGPDGSWRAFEK